MAELDARRVEVLANAARLVQRHIKAYLMRKEFINLRKATIQSQKFWRGIFFTSLPSACHIMTSVKWLLLQTNVQRYQILQHD
jgi:hypothetical protein